MAEVKVKALRLLLKKRSDQWAEISDVILELIEPTVIAAVIEMLQLKEQEVERLNWHNLQVVDDMFMLVGTINYKEDDIIVDGDKKIAVTKELATLMDKLIRVSIPLDLADGGSKEEIISHLRMMEKKMREEYEKAYNADPETREDFEEELIRALHDYPAYGMDFNYSDLTEEQRKSLALHQMTSTYEKKGKLN